MNYAPWVATPDPVRRAQHHVQALTTTWTVEPRRQSGGADLSPVAGGRQPIQPGGAALVADAPVARWEEHRLVLGLAGRDPQPYRQLTDHLVGRLDRAAPLEIGELAALERRLAARPAHERPGHLATGIDRAAASALDVDIVVKRAGHRAALAAS